MIMKLPLNKPSPPTPCKYSHNISALKLTSFFFLGVGRGGRGGEALFCNLGGWVTLILLGRGIGDWASE